MIRAFFEHHVQRFERGAPVNVINNCHVRGLWSVMLHDEFANRVRLFFADEDHELWLNDKSPHVHNSVGFHAHHCDVTLVRVGGFVANVVCDGFTPSENGYFFACEYRSAIVDGFSVLKPREGRYDIVNMKHRFLTERGDFMKSSDLHTVWVERGKRAAWLVFEGVEDPNYKSIMYTNNPTFDPTGLYVRGDTAMAIYVLRAVLKEFS